jgi:hypothetical protein
VTRKHKTRNSTFGYATGVPLTNVEPGRYLLRVEAAAHGTGNVNDVKPAARETLITVK